MAEPPPLPGRGAEPPPIPPTYRHPPPPDEIGTEFVARRSGLFGLALWTGLLTILTLGFYRFWMKTRLRRYYWSGIRPGGIPLEYTGTALEKLMGFLVAVVILAFYIGLVNLLLMFVSLSLLADNFAAYVVSLIGVVPIWFYASYRSRRYVLSRTRWRGIRFALEPGAWGYAGRALWHWGLTVLSCGLLWPRMTFWLEKYRTDRTFYGSVRLQQGGSWKMLYRPFLDVLIPVAGFVTIVAVFYFADGTAARYLPLLWLFIPLGLWLSFGLVNYSVKATRRLTETKTAGALGLIAQPRTGRVYRIYGLGYLLTWLAMAIPLTPLTVLFGLMQAERMTRGEAPAGDLGHLLNLSPGTYIVVGIVTYFGAFLSWSVLRHVFVTLPLWRHYAETLTITGTPALAAVRQRARDTSIEAEGFAEALDVGAAI